MENGLVLVGWSVLVGGGATLVMDAWLLFLRRAFGVRTLDYAMLGRWLAHVPRGTFVHESIAKAAPVRGERALGWCAHYGIGIAFAALLLGLTGVEWVRTPSLPPALGIGLLTVLAPLFVLQPALGAGIASSRLPNPNASRLRSVATHAVYGLGLYASARLWAAIL
ncbi:MAG: DUF2938 domain-containing protein [Vicinamibacteria bacterium]